MNQSEKKMTPAPPEGNVLSIPNIMLEAAGIPKDSDLTVETLPGVLLIGHEAVSYTHLDVYKRQGHENAVDDGTANE